MERDNLRQVDLPELGSQGVVSKLLSGRRDFNARQAKVMAARFGVSAALFFKKWRQNQRTAFNITLCGITKSSPMRDCKTP